MGQSGFMRVSSRTQAETMGKEAFFAHENKLELLRATLPPFRENLNKNKTKVEKSRT